MVTEIEMTFNSIIGRDISAEMLCLALTASAIGSSQPVHEEDDNNISL